MTKKVTKKSRRFDAEESSKWKFSYDESPGGKVIWMEGLKVEDSASCYYTFHGGAVFFTTGCILIWSIRRVKNKALGESLKFKEVAW